MKVLLTNDDGWDAGGIRILYEKLKERHEVAICAPDKNRSGVSQHITMDSPLKIQKHGVNIFSCSGYPADCVIVATRSSLFPFMPDIVVSGINKGSNLGTDILYSGTVSAARQGVLYGFPSVAFSVGSHDWETWKFDRMAEFAAKNLEKLAAISEPCVKNGTSFHGIFVNVNANSADSYKGVRFAKDLSFREYSDSITLIEAPDGSNYSFFIGGKIVSHGSSESDAALCDDGFVSIARVCVQSSCVVDESVDVKEFYL